MALSEPLISVIIPVYKVETYLDQCVQSVVDQTYRNLEIILVDDGSPDTCPVMCDKWAERDSRIKVVHKTNGGLGDARNAGLEVATGDYIGFVDSDDWCEKDMYQSLLDSCVKNDAPLSICNVFVDWECGWPTEKTVFAEAAKCLAGKDALRMYLADDLTAWAWNKLYRSDLKEFLQYPKQSYEDIPVARALFSKVEKVALTGDCHYHYRQRQGSIVNSKVNVSQFKLIEELRENVKLAKSFGLEKEAVARLTVSAFNFLEKICANPTDELCELIPSLVADVCQGKEYAASVSVRRLDKMFMRGIMLGLPCKGVFAARRILQWFYWKLNLKK
ncbi:MAG: glycosyltransferase [Fibrobacter sp.]|nr:glycosyltransferase [Fibrobacter sp.]